jgi:hypothetical protein
MKKIFFLSTALFLLAIAGYSQTDSTETDFEKEMSKMLTTKIKMEVDSQLYATRQGNFYISEKPQAMIMAVLLPSTFDAAKERLSDEYFKKKKIVVKDAGEFVSNGKKIIFKIGEMKEKGQKMVFELYAVEATEKSTILITGVYLPKDKARFANSTKKAASSAMLE